MFRYAPHAGPPRRPGSSCCVRRSRARPRAAPLSGDERMSKATLSARRSPCRSAFGPRSRTPRSGWRWSASKPRAWGASCGSTGRCARSPACRRSGCWALHVASIASHEDDASATAGIRRLLADDESVYSTERRYARPDGSVVWVELRMSLIRDESGGPLNFLAQVVDLTERKQAEDAPGAPGRDRRVLRGRDRRPGPRRDDRQLEPGRRAPLRVPRRRGGRQAHLRC